MSVGRSGRREPEALRVVEPDAFGALAIASSSTASATTTTSTRGRRRPRPEALVGLESAHEVRIELDRVEGERRGAWRRTRSPSRGAHRVRASVAASAAPRSSMTMFTPRLCSITRRSRLRKRREAGGAPPPRTRARDPVISFSCSRLSCSRCSMRFGRSLRSRWSSNRFTDTVIGRAGNVLPPLGARRAASITTDQPMRTSSVLSSSSTRNSPGASRPLAGKVPAQQRLHLDRDAGARGRTPVGRGGSAHRSRARAAAATRGRPWAGRGSWQHPPPVPRAAHPVRRQRDRLRRRRRLSAPAVLGGVRRPAAAGRDRRGDGPRWRAAAGRARGPRPGGRRTRAGR